MKKVLTLFTALSALVVFNVAPVSAEGEGGWAKNFYLESADGDYKLQFKGRIQGRFAFANQEANDNTVNNNDSVESFMLRRTYFTLTGHVFTKKLTFDITFDVPGTSMQYSWMNYEFAESFQLQAGLFKIPFNRQEITSSGKQQFVDRSLANERYNLDRSIGLVAHGTFFDSKMEYYVSTFNGRATRTALNTNSELGFTGRLVYNPLGSYGYGESAHENKDEVDLTFGLAGAWFYEEDTVSTNQDRVMTGNADVGFKYKGLSFQAEVFYRNTDSRTAGIDSNTDYGYYAQVGYFIIPKKLEIAARASSIFDDDSSTIFTNGSLTGLGGLFDGVDEGSDADDEHEFSLAMSYYFNKTNIKLQAQYTMMLDGTTADSLAGESITNHIGMLQAQLEF